MTVFILVNFFVLACMFSVLVNRDIFSPGKLFLLFFLVFHAGILFVEVKPATGALILLVLSVSVVMIMLEGARAHRAPPLKRRPPAPYAPGEHRSFTLFFWLISIPSVAAQLYMIQQFGGIAGYVNSVGLRVVEWSGYGWARMLIFLFVPLNLAYFALGLNRSRSKRWWLIYLLHFLILLAMGTLSGSRSSLLTAFALQAFLYHYLRAPIAGRTAAILATCLVFSAMVLGVVRQGVSFDAGRLSLGNSSGRTVSFATFYYGVDPIEIIVSSGHMPLANGSTFVSLLTNAVPRSIWPEKPDTGGVFFTKNYAGNAWLGYSNLTPTFLGEWLINFGWTFGILGFFMSFSALMMWLVRYYFRIRSRLSVDRSDQAALQLVIYAHVAWALMALMVGELTNVILTFALSQLLPLWMIKEYVRRTAATGPEARGDTPRRTAGSRPLAIGAGR